MKKALLVFAAFSMLLFATTAQAEIITNGTFDTGTDGWFVTGAEWQGGAVNLAPNIFANGSTLTQFFTIPAGTDKLTLSFDLNIYLSAVGAAAGGSALSVYFGSIDLGFKDTLLYTWALADADASLFGKTFINETLSFDLDFNRVLTLPIDNAMISFVFASGGTFVNFNVLVDNVMFSASTPTPVPAAVWLLGSGVAGIVALRRKMQ